MDGGTVAGFRGLADEVRALPLGEVAPLLGYCRDSSDRARWRLGSVANNSMVQSLAMNCLQQSLLISGPLARNARAIAREGGERACAFMRRIGVCEERGSGVDKVVFESELYQLPPPRWETSGDSSRAVLFAHKGFKNMNKAERVHACYLHACLKYVMREEMTNTSLRKRFGFAEKNSAMASRIIRDALDEGVIRPFDPNQGKRNARYIPVWA